MLPSAGQSEEIPLVGGTKMLGNFGNKLQSTRRHIPKDLILNCNKMFRTWAFICINYLLPIETIAIG